LQEEGSEQGASSLAYFHAPDASCDSVVFRSALLWLDHVSHVRGSEEKSAMSDSACALEASDSCCSISEACEPLGHHYLVVGNSYKSGRGSAPAFRFARLRPWLVSLFAGASPNQRVIEISANVLDVAWFECRLPLPCAANALA
jgi:hypothetical protein